MTRPAAAVKAVRRGGLTTGSGPQPIRARARKNPAMDVVEGGRKDVVDEA